MGVTSPWMVSLSRFDAALQKARKERDIKRRGTFKRANKNRYTLLYKLPTDVQFHVARWWMMWNYIDITFQHIPAVARSHGSWPDASWVNIYTSAWPDMYFPIVLPGLERSPLRSRCQGSRKLSQWRNMGKSEILGLMRGQDHLMRVCLRSRMHFWTTWRRVRNEWFRRRQGGPGTQRREHSCRHSFSKWWVVLCYVFCVVVKKRKQSAQH